MTGEVRVDALSGAAVVIVADRQHRPNLPDGACPFCPGGLEAPDDYEVRWFPNRWPAMDGARCEVLLYAPQHAVGLADLGAAQVRKVVDLWAGRTAALSARADVAYVLVFENRGRDVGATIDHPHGQIYAFAEVPPAPLAEAQQPHAAEALDGATAGERLVSRMAGWRAWVPPAPVHPIELLIAPDTPVPDLPSLDEGARNALADILLDVLAGLDAHLGEPAPYMLVVHQRPSDGREWPVGLHIHVQSPWRAPGVLRYIAAGELGSGVYFNPVVPERLAADLRRVRRPQLPEEPR